MLLRFSRNAVFRNFSNTLAECRILQRSYSDLSEKTYMDADSAIDLQRIKVNRVEASAAISRLSNRDKNFRIKLANRVISPNVESPTLFLSVASTFRRTLDAESYYDELLRKIQPDAIVFAVEDEFRNYIFAEDTLPLIKKNTGIFHFLSSIQKHGFYKAQQNNFLHRMLDYLSFYRESRPYENYNIILKKAKYVNGTRLYTAGRFGYKQSGVSLDVMPTSIQLAHMTYSFAFLINHLIDFTNDTEFFTHTRHGIQISPYYPLDMFARCSDLMSSVNHIRTQLKITLDKVKEEEPNLPSKIEPVILVVAEPIIADILRGYKSFFEKPSHELDREELDLFEISYDCVDKISQSDSSLIQELKYKTSLQPPLLI